MFKTIIKIGVPCFLLMSIVAAAADGISTVSVTNIRKNAPKVFLDGRSIDKNYIKTEIPFVNYVRERKEADIHLLITTQTTGSGGREYTLAFIGQNESIKMQNTLKYFAGSTDTKSETRLGLVKTIKMGLAPYIANSAIASSFTLNFRDKINYQNDKGDKWNNWVFSTSLSSSLMGQKTNNSKSYSGSLTAERVTAASRVRLHVNGRYQKSSYNFSSYNYENITENAEFSSIWVKSLTEHWSVGGWISAKTSSYNNIDYSFKPQPAIEYNFFPYAESTRRQLRLLYKMGYEKNSYREVTVYNKLKEQLFSQSLSATLELTELWGNARFSIEGSHYFHDMSKNEFIFNGNLSLRIVRGLSLDINGQYSATHNQLALPMGKVSTEDLLLRRKEMASDYNYYISIGFGYRFGSLFNNVVNPRFGASSRRGRMYRRH